MDAGTIQIITTTLSVLGTITVAFLTSRSTQHSKTASEDTKNTSDKVDTLETTVNSMSKKVDIMDKRISDNDAITCRLDLIQALEHDPENIEGILECARHYFLELGGDFYVSKPFIKWANEYNVDLSEFMKVKHLQTPKE